MKEQVVGILSKILQKPAQSLVQARAWHAEKPAPLCLGLASAPVFWNTFQIDIANLLQSQEQVMDKDTNQLHPQENAPAAQKYSAPDHEESPPLSDVASTSESTQDLDDDARPATPASPAPEAVTACPAGPLGRIFDAFSHAGLLILLVLCMVMTCSEVLQIRDLWFSDEVHLADVLQRLLHGDWLVLTMNGMPYADKPPLYFWAMQALCMIPGISPNMAIFLAVAASHALFTLSVWILARGTGHDNRTALAAGLLVLCCAYVSGAACHPRMDLLFAALIVLAMTCLYRGWIKESAPFWLGAGFLLLGISTLVKGPLGIGLALATSILFHFWRGTPKRLNGVDGLPGFLLMLALIVAWLGALYMSSGTGYLRDMISGQLAGHIFGEGAPHAHPWWYYLAAIPLMWLPWVLIVLFVNWLAAVRGIPAIWKNRKIEGGSGWLWIWLLSGVAILSAVHSKIAVYALPLLAPLAVLTARSLLKLSPGRSRWFFSLVSVILFCAGLLLVLVDVFPLLRVHVPEGWLPPVPPVAEAWLAVVHGTSLMGCILMLTALCLLMAVRLSHPGGSLLAATVGMIAMVVPYQLVVAPSLSGILGPCAQAEVMLEKMKDGYAPAAFKVYHGAYAWHLNQLANSTDTLLNVPDLDDDAALDIWLEQNPKAVIAMSEQTWETWAHKPDSASVLLRTWMVDKPYVVTVMGVASPAPTPDTENQNTESQSEAVSPDASESANGTADAASDPASERTEDPAEAQSETPDAPGSDSATPDASNTDDTPETAPDSRERSLELETLALNLLQSADILLSGHTIPATAKG